MVKKSLIALTFERIHWYNFGVKHEYESGFYHSVAYMLDLAVRRNTWEIGSNVETVVRPATTVAKHITLIMTLYIGQS